MQFVESICVEHDPLCAIATGAFDRVAVGGKQNIKSSPKLLHVPSCLMNAVQS
jgi:hypothetical protein